MLAVSRAHSCSEGTEARHPTPLECVRTFVESVPGDAAGVRYPRGVHDEFRMDDEPLGVDRAKSSVVIGDSGTLTAELHAANPPITASEWAQSPPRLYFRNVPLVSERGRRILIVDDDTLDEHDIALYFVEHHDIEGTLTLSPDGALTFDGFTRLDLRPEDHTRTTRIMVRWAPEE